MSEITEKNECL